VPQRVHAIELLDVLGLVELAMAFARDLAVHRVERGDRPDGAGRGEGARGRRVRLAGRGWGTGRGWRAGRGRVGGGPDLCTAAARPGVARMPFTAPKISAPRSPTLAPTSTAARTSSSR
jgi:hypothetical protein